MVTLLRRPRARPIEAAEISDTVLRVSVLLRAGVAPARAWLHLADSGDPVADRVSAAVRRGEGVADTLAAEGGPWREVAAAWTVASTVGAPLAESLRDTSSALRDAQRTRDEVRVVLAEPAATARVMGWLPLVAVVLGVVLGFDTIGVVLGSPIGAGCVIVGLALIVVARRWTTVLVRRARPALDIPGTVSELTAIALGGGVSIDRARELVAAALPGADLGEVHDALELSRSAGVPAVELLRSAAWLARHRARTAGRLAAARLGARLLLPLGVCTLPSFLLLGVAPMLLSVLSSGVLVL